MNSALKYFLIALFTTLFTGLVWLFGVIGSEQPSDKFLAYMSLTCQLLYGNICYDILKELISISPTDNFWKLARATVFGVIFWILVIFVCLLLAFKVFLLTWVALGGALVAYIYMLTKVVFPLAPAYRESTKKRTS
jgi:hypothetical protein